MKKSLYFLFIIIFAIFLTACNIQSVEEFEQMEDQEESITPSPDEIKSDEIETDSEIKNDEKLEEKEQPVEEKQAIEADSKESESRETEATKKEEPIKKDTVKETVEEKQPKEKAPSSTNNKAPQQTKTERPKKKDTVTITIRVDTLLRNWDLLDPSLQSSRYVPDSGIILKKTTYELLSPKDTVWNILQRATKEHNIHLEYEGANENIYNSVYIEGINHLYEFSAGPLSGWMYKVNGIYPGYGASQYVLKNGDVIEWHYTVDLGKDLGHEWMGN